MSRARSLFLIISLVALAFCTHAAFAGQESTKAQEHAGRGLQLAQNGDLKGAEKELRRAVELAPHDPVYLGSLGVILGLQRKLEESNTYLEKALKLNPDDLATRRNLASNQFQLGQLKPAKENLERILKAKPDDATVLLLLGMVAEESKEYSNAAKLLESVSEQVRQRPESIAALARSYYKIGQKEKARETLKELRSHPAGPEGVFLGGEEAAQAGDFETAEEMFASVWTTYPDTAKLGYNLALAQYRANRVEESQATLRKLIGSAHETSAIYNLMGWCFEKQGNFKEAVAAMDRAIELDPSKESNYLDVGMILVEHRRLPGALVAADKAVEVAPNSYQAYRLKGLVESKLYYVSDAVQSYARAVELNPTAPEALLGLALAQSADGRTQDAEATFKKGIEQFPHNAVFYVEYGSMLLNVGGGNDSFTESRAVSLLQTAIAVDDSLAEPHYQLGNLALTKGKAQEAVQHLEVAAKLDAKGSKIHYSLSRAYRRLGRGEDASKELRLYKSLMAAEDKSASGGSAGGSKPAIPEKQLIPSEPK